MHTMTLGRCLDSAGRRTMWDLRDRLKKEEQDSLLKGRRRIRPIRFNRNGIRILEVHSYAHAR